MQETTKIRGIGIPQESNEKRIHTAYVITLDDVRLAVLGNIPNGLPDDVLDKIGEVDILFIPAQMETKEAIALIREVEPKMVVPLGGDVKRLGKELGQTPEPEPKLVVKRKDFETQGAAVKIAWIQE